MLVQSSSVEEFARGREMKDELMMIMTSMMLHKFGASRVKRDGQIVERKRRKKTRNPDDDER